MKLFIHVAIINNLNVFVRRKFTGKLEEPDALK